MMNKWTVGVLLFVLLAAAACGPAAELPNDNQGQEGEGQEAPLLTDDDRQLEPGVGAPPAASDDQNRSEHPDDQDNQTAPPAFSGEDRQPGQLANQEQQRAAAFVQSAEVLVLESAPVQVVLHVTGRLPSPCHHFQAEVAGPDAENKISVQVYSLVAASGVCAQVIKPFSEDVSIPLADAPAGEYTVWIGGKQVGQFSYPGGGE